MSRLYRGHLSEVAASLQTQERLQERTKLISQDRPFLPLLPALLASPPLFYILKYST
jgi:hypothetical protein